MRCLIVVPSLFLLTAATELPEAAPVPVENPRPSDSDAQEESDAAVEPDSGTDSGNPSANDTTGDAAADAEVSDEANEKADTELPDPATAEDQPPEPADEAALAECEAELRALGAVFERRELIDGDGACGVSAPYNLREAAPGVIVKPDTEMTCAAALATARWVRDEVLPATAALGDGVELSEVIHASTYVCRSRNNQPGAKISEHARGSAVDISSFDFDGHDPIPVVPRAGKGTIEEAFQRSVRAGACMHFTTVLGPGSDEYHDDHLHFDLAERNSGYRLCQ